MTEAKPWAKWPIPPIGGFALTKPVRLPNRVIPLKAITCARIGFLYFSYASHSLSRGHEFQFFGPGIPSKGGRFRHHGERPTWLDPRIQSYLCIRYARKHSLDRFYAAHYRLNDGSAPAIGDRKTWSFRRFSARYAYFSSTCNTLLVWRPLDVAP